MADFEEYYLRAFTELEDARAENLALNEAMAILVKEHEAGLREHVVLEGKVLEQAKEIERLKEQLGRIVSECEASSEQSKRIRRIAARANAALSAKAAWALF